MKRQADGSPKHFSKCFMFLFSPNHGVCPLRRMTERRGEGYSYASICSALLRCAWLD